MTIRDTIELKPEDIKNSTDQMLVSLHQAYANQLNELIFMYERNRKDMLTRASGMGLPPSQKVNAATHDLLDIVQVVNKI